MLNDIKSTLVDRLRHALIQRDIHDAGIVVAVSGGADSVGLSQGLLQLQNEFTLSLHLAHLDHRLRTRESSEDADWLRTFADRHSLPLTVGREDVRTFAEQQNLGIEAAARDVRYRFLVRTAEQLGFPYVAVAHTSDDQVETVLHHVLRGTGLAGLQGIPPTRQLTESVTLIRPLLDISRKDVETFLSELSQEFRTDTSNSDPAFTRNRIRHQLLPLLEEQFNPSVREAILRLSHQVSETQAGIDGLVNEILNRALTDAGPCAARLRRDELSGWPVHLIRECFRHVWQRQQWPRQAMGFREWDRLAQVTLEGGATTLPGNIDCRLRNQLVVITVNQDETGSRPPTP